MSESSKPLDKAVKTGAEKVIRASPSADLSVGNQTLYELLQLSKERHGKRPCLGTRLKHLNGEWAEYHWITYDEVFDMARKLGSGLVKLGLQPGSMIGVYSTNSVEWIVTMIAASAASIIVVPLYDVAGPKSIQTIVSLTKLSIIISSPANITALGEAALSCHSIKTVIMTGKSERDVSYLTRQGVQVMAFDLVMKDGESNPISLSPPKLDSVYMIMFTSGDAKGVVLSHRNLSTALTSVSRAISLQPDDVYVSYLPLAHIMEHLCVLHVLTSGASLGFWRGHIQTLWDDLKVLRPTIFAGVPSVFNRMYDGIHSNLLKSNPIRRLFFSYAYSAKRKQVEAGEDTAFWDKLVFNKMSDPIGGRVRLFLSAAAPLTPKVSNFLKMCFCCPVIQAYGMTETTGALTLTRLELVNSKPKQQIGTVGEPLDCNEIKLIPVPEMDIHEENVGEVCVRGANIFLGYYGEGGHHFKSSVFDNDGWFHTGDIASWDPSHRTLSIIDTKKNLFKLAQGEYIATDFLQSLYGASVYVSQIAIVGRSTENYIVAIVVPFRPTISRWANQNKMETTDFAELCRHPAVKRLVFEDLVRCANLQQLRGFQIVRNIHLEPQPWTVENGFLQPWGKLKRSKIQSTYKDVIDFLYSQPKMDADHPTPPARL